MSLLKAFFRANREMARHLTPYLPQGPPGAWEDYNAAVIKYLGLRERPVVLDIGGGAQCYFSPFKPPGARIICLDVSFSQLVRNREAEELVLADATRELPLADASVDLVISRAVLEHLESPEAFLRHSFRVLKPGGYAIHVFPCKFAPFAVINNLLPPALSRRVLYYFQPDFQEKGGFPAYYRKCYYIGIKRLLRETGYEIKELRDFHSQSVYFDFFLPVFLLSALYEIATLPFKNLASFLLVIAQKPQGPRAAKF